MLKGRTKKREPLRIPGHLHFLIFMEHIKFKLSNCCGPKKIGTQIQSNAVQQFNRKGQKIKADCILTAVVICKSYSRLLLFVLYKLNFTVSVKYKIR